MNLLKRGKSILTNNCVTNITHIGFWILINETEYFIPFEEYPVFKKASISQIEDFRMLSPKQITWQQLDCDIELDALIYPKNFPLQFGK